MVQYRRSRVAGGTFFFTVNLQDRRRTLLVEHADGLRTIVRNAQTETPFVIDDTVTEKQYASMKLLVGLPLFQEKSVKANQLLLF